MFRPVTLAALSLALVVGFALAPVGAADDPTATYTIKLAREKAGDETSNTETEKGTFEITAGGQTEKEKAEKKFVFEEKIIEAPKQAGEKPAKLTRTYKTAQKYDGTANEMKALPFEGKTVTIEKKEKGYEFSIDGKQMDAADAAELQSEFAGKGKSNIEELLPKNAVKVGESWTIDPTKVKSLNTDPTFPVDAKKSKMSGKLTKAYTKDGKQWGVLAFEIELVLDPTALKDKKDESKGTIKATATLDVVIDGSARDGSMTMNFKMDASANAVRVVADMTQMKTLKTVKAGK